MNVIGSSGFGIAISPEPIVTAAASAPFSLTSTETACLSRISPLNCCVNNVKSASWRCLIPAAVKMSSILKVWLILNFGSRTVTLLNVCASDLMRVYFSGVRIVGSRIDLSAFGSIISMLNAWLPNGMLMYSRFSSV